MIPQLIQLLERCGIPVRAAEPVEATPPEAPKPAPRPAKKATKKPAPASRRKPKER